MTSSLWRVAVVAAICALPVTAQAAGAPPAGTPAGNDAKPPAVAPGAPEGADVFAAFDFEGVDLLAADLGPGPGGPHEAPMGDAGGYGGMGMHHGGQGGMGMHGGGPGAPMGGPGGMRQHWAKMAEKLDLTDAQREKIRDIMEQQQRRGIQQRADIQLATLDLHKLMRADVPSKTSIDTQVDKVARLRATLAKDRIGAMLQAQAVLTPEQKKQLQTMRSGGMHERDGDDEGAKGQGKP